MAQTGPQTAQKLATAKEVDGIYGERTLEWFFHGFGNLAWIRVTIDSVDTGGQLARAIGPSGEQFGVNFSVALVPNPGESWWAMLDHSTGAYWLDDLIRT